MGQPAVAVVGGYRTPPRGNLDNQQLEEMVFETTRRTLTDAALSLDDIDAIVIGVADQAHGRVIESMVLAGAVGAVGRDLTTLASGSEHAFVYAYLRLLSGQGRRILAVAWGKPSEGKDPLHAERVGAEPFIMRQLGITERAAAGLQASSYQARHGASPAEVEALRAARESQAKLAHGGEVLGSDHSSDELVAWPLRAGDLPQLCDMAAAMVLSVEDAVADEQVPAWITGIGWATDAYDLGVRDLSRLKALEIAARRAQPDVALRRSVDVVEVQELSTVGAFAAYEAIGLAGLGEGHIAALADAPRVNPSGGNLPLHPGAAAGFIRFLEAAAQVRGRAGPVQLTPRPSSSLGAAVNGFAGQGATVVTFNSERKAVP